MTEMIMSVILAFGVSFYALPALIHVAKKKKLFDHPDQRKVHLRPIPALGGLAIYAGFITSFLLTVSFAGENHTLQYVVAASLIMFFIGLKDDLLNITALKKFLGQVLAACLLVFKGGLVIPSMYGIFGVFELQPIAANLLSVFTILVIINAYNLIDGIDGLAASLSMISAAFFAVYFAVNQDWVYASMAGSLFGGLSAFLIFNFPPARIFMGDTGSLMLGLLHGIMGIHFIQTGAGNTIWPIAAPAGIALAIMFVPLFDTFRVFSYRILSGTPPFTPDKSHIHHLLLRLGFSHLKVSGLLASVSLTILAICYQLQFIGNTGILILLAVVGFSSTIALILQVRKLEKSMADSDTQIKPLLKGSKKEPLKKPNEVAVFRNIPGKAANS